MAVLAAQLVLVEPVEVTLKLPPVALVISPAWIAALQAVPFLE